MNDDEDSRPVEIWNEYNKKWKDINFEHLEPGDIVRFDINNDYIYRVISYPFMSYKYSPYKDKPVSTIMCSEFLYWCENN